MRPFSDITNYGRVWRKGAGKRRLECGSNPAWQSFSLLVAFFFFKCFFASEYWGRGAQDGHLDFHTAPQLCRDFKCNIVFPQKPWRLLGTGNPGRPPRLSHSSSALSRLQMQYCFTSTETMETIRDGEPRTATSTFTQLLSSVETSNAILFYLHRNHGDY